MTADEIGEAVGCTGSHIRNILAGRKQASLSLALRLHALSGVSMESFLKPEEAA
jgi:plasmid maintenance system antidote protein VapI